MRLWLGIILIVGVLVVSGTERGRAGKTGRDYLIKYVTSTSLVESRKEGLGQLKVMAYDTRADTHTRVDEPFRDKIRVNWCNDWDFLESTRYPRHDTLPIMWSEVPGVKKLLDSVRATLSPDIVLSVGGSSWRACHPPSGKQAIIGAIYGPPEGGHKTFARFFGTYDQDAGDVSVMPEEVCESHDKWWRNFHRPFFDADGEYLYYSWGGRAMRYNVGTHKLDNLPSGNVPIIPWNGKAVIVHTTDRSQFRLLDGDMNVRAIIDGELVGIVLSALAVDDQTFLFSCTYFPHTEFSLGISDPGLRMATFELDFKSGDVNELFNDIDFSSQLIDVHIID